MAKNKATRLIRRRSDLLNSAPDRLVDNLKSTQDDLYNEIKDLLTLLHIEGGRLVFDSETATAINKIEQRIRKAIRASQYQDDVAKYLISFNDVAELSKEYFAVAEGINIRVGANSLRRTIIDQVKYSLLENGLDAQFTQPIKNLLNAGAISGQSVVEFQAQLSRFIKGGVLQGNKTLGFFERYVPQIAYDAIGQFDGTVQTRVKNKYKMNAWRYLGSLIEGSRPQCVRWVGMKTIKDENLSREIDWATANGTGLIPQTTPETFGIYRGGYRCRHRATAVRV